MTGEERYINERLDHLGIVAGVCQEIGLYAAGEEAGETAVIAITYGYSRDYRTDLKQWMLATSDDTRW